MGVDGVQGGAWQCEWIQGDAGGCQGTVCFGVGGGGDTKGCTRLQVDAGGCGGLYNSPVAIILSMCTKLNIYI